MRFFGVSSGSPPRPPWPPLGSTALLVALLAVGLPAGALSGPPPPPALSLVEPLPVALASGHVRAEDLRGREVYADDETRIGTLTATAEAAVIVLDPRLGRGRGCVATSLWRLWLTQERRLILHMTTHQFEAVLAARRACGD